MNATCPSVQRIFKPELVPVQIPCPVRRKDHGFGNSDGLQSVLSGRACSLPFPSQPRDHSGVFRASVL